MKKILPLALLFVSVSSVAVDRSWTKTDTPSRMLFSSFATLSNFTPLASELRGKGLGEYPKITSVEWASTYYPGSVGETVELCQITGKKECERIMPDSFGMTRKFNKLTFTNTTFFVIRHAREAGEINTLPAGRERVVVHYTY